MPKTPSCTSTTRRLTRLGRSAAAALWLAGCGGGGMVPMGPGPLSFGPGPVVDRTKGQLTRERIDPSTEPVDRGAYRIRSGDVLTISILGESEMKETLPVGPDGRISYYVADDVPAAGRTFADLRKALREKLLVHFRDPQVTVMGANFSGNTVTILGQVRSPGEYTVRSDTRLLDVIALAGGIARTAYVRDVYGALDLADLSRAFLLRGPAFVDVDFEALFSDDEMAVARNNTYVLAGDRVYIPSSAAMENRVFVLGEVASPKVVRFQREMSLVEAIAEAGGVKPSAWERRAFVVRGSLRDPEVIPINLRLAATGRVPNVPLEAGDIVYVPKTVLGKTAEITRQIIPLLDTTSRVRGMW
jgi:polysaccharide export outer membrane protein